MHRNLCRAYRLLERTLSRWVNKLRVFRLRLLGAQLGRGVRAYGRFTLIGDPRNLQIGDYTTINEGVHLNARGPLVIGSHVHLSSGVQIHTGEIDPQDPRRAHRAKPVTIADHAWIASGAIIVPGVHIGRGSIIGAMALVATDIEAQVLAVGIPARAKKRLPDAS